MNIPSAQSVAIVPHCKQYEKEAAALILHIQTKEFGIPITLEDQPDLLDVENFYQTGNGNFWLALINDQVVGTIALIDIGEKLVVMRKMFVDQSHRGKEPGVAKLLLDTTFRWCRQRGVKAMFLGTVDKYFAAHRFYEKNGFKEVSVEELPERFPRMKVDTKFYAYTF